MYIYCSAGIRERTNVADDVGMALFISDQTDALRVVTGFMQGYGHGEHLHLYHKMPSWGVSEKTFSLRASGANVINYQSIYNSAALARYSESASETLFFVEEIST